MARILIGIGNPDRGDDAAGWEVADRVSNWEARRSHGGSFDLVDAWGTGDDVVIVDAMRSGRRPGTVVQFDAVDELPLGVFSSTHSFGPVALVELAKSMDKLPRSLTIVGIEADTFEMGAAMTPAVAEAVSVVAEELNHA
ncbi:MAG: hydrogenase maturation protease [Acidimicrobiia bacterium]|nr:hydrogenase maturation protease [Acidimicrobiia bacterium]